MKKINEFKYMKKTSQHLKSWASVKRACQFDSGPGHHFQQYQVLSNVYPNYQTLDQSGIKRSQNDITDTTVTPLVEVR